MLKCFIKRRPLCLILFDYGAITEARKVGDPLLVPLFKEGYTLSYTIGEENVKYMPSKLCKSNV